MLLPAEKLMLRLICIVFAIDVVLVFLKDLAVDVPGYAASFGCGALLVGGGLFYRNVRRNPRIAAALVAAGIFVLLTLVGSLFNYMFLPVMFTPIDPVLLRIDGSIGYSWSGLTTWVAHYPLLGQVLYLVYTTSLPQLLFLVLVLGFSGRIAMLQHFMLTGLVGALLTILSWILFPSFGASAYEILPPWVTDTMVVAVDPAYGQKLVRMAAEGPDYLSPKNVLGLIGFPSFHMFMACLCIGFAPKIAWLRVAIWALNIVMVPAILVQGGHHLVDVFGGAVVFLLAFWAAGHMLRHLDPADVEHGPAPVVTSP